MSELHGANTDVDDHRPEPAQDAAPAAEQTRPENEVHQPKAEPLNRIQYAEQVRGDDKRGSSSDHDDGPSTEDGVRSLAGYHDAHRESAEPRTRQDVTAEARASREQEGDAWPTKEERERLHDLYLDYRKEMEAGGQRGVGIVGDKPDHSPDDLSHRPPTGEQLLQMETDDPAESRLDKLLAKAVEGADDLHDGVGNMAESVFDFRQSPHGPAGELVGHQGHVGHEPQPPDAPGISDAVGSAVIVGVTALTFARHWFGHHRKDDQP